MAFNPYLNQNKKQATVSNPSSQPVAKSQPVTANNSKAVQAEVASPTNVQNPERSLFAANEDIASAAEKLVASLDKKRVRDVEVISLTTSQIRKFLSAVNVINNRVLAYKAQNYQSAALSVELTNEIKYLKVKLAYQAGREKNVKDFIAKAKLFDKIDEIGNSLKRYEEFAKYIEAIVAYHKFAGGKD